MKPVPGIVVYKACDPVTPGREYLAQFYTMVLSKPDDGSEPKEIMKFLPLHFMGSTAETVIQNAEAFWEERQRIEANKHAPRKKKEVPDAAA